MPYPMEHAARMLDPKLFDTFARKNIAKGVDVILGIKNGQSRAQSYRFDAAMFTSERAMKWMQDNGLKYSAFEKATGKMQSFVTLVAHIQAFTSEEILKLIPEDTLKAIKEKDATPFFQAYSICHEGTSRPAILGDTSKPIHWTRAAVQSMKNAVAKGIKFFAGHNEDNSTANRDSLGEVVADFQKEIDGNLHHIVIGYFPDKAKVASMDICSQEANWNFFEAAGQWFADTIEKVTGIALSNSKTDVPAFSGAKRLGMVQAFENTSRRKVRAMGDLDIGSIALSDLKAEIARRGVAASEIFSMDDIKKDRVFGKSFDEMEALKTASTKKDEDIKKLNDEKSASDKKSAASTAKTRFETLVNAMPGTDKMKMYIKSSFNENLPDLTDVGLKQLIDVKTVDYQNVAKALGVKDDLPAQRETKPGTGDSEDLTKAENNPLLEEDITLS